jgi:hypothetical protein
MRLLFLYWPDTQTSTIFYIMAGYSSTPLIKKLGIKAGTALYILNPPSDYFNLISPLPQEVRVQKKLSGDLDFIHLFVRDQKSLLKEFVKSKNHLNKNGMLWVSWPKKASKVSTDLNESAIRDFGLANGLVDVKVCAVDEVWSGLKFVFRVADR